MRGSSKPTGFGTRAQCTGWPFPAELQRPAPLFVVESGVLDVTEERGYTVQVIGIVV